MTDTPTIFCRAHEPAVERKALPWSTTLPSILIEKVPQRLAGAALFYSTAYTLAWGGPDLFRLYGADAEVAASRPAWATTELAAAFERSRPEVTFVGILSILFGLAVFVAVRRTKLSTQTVSILAHLLLIMGAFGIAFGENWHPVLPFPKVGISWVCYWIGCYPFAVPSRPRGTFLGSMIAASTSLVVILAAGCFDLGVPDAESVVSWVLPNYVTAALATMGAVFVSRTGHEIDRAQQMGSYRLVDKIGAGGMGEVWRAEHHMLARPAAVKLIRPDALGQKDAADASTVIRRFEREAQATALLGSPHTVDVFDFGVTETGAFYYVMELLDGFELETLVRRFGPQPFERVIHILRQVCHSLEDAHRQGMIHRDIKPSNVFLCRKGIDLDFVKVLDFGLVKPTDAREEDAHLTADGVSAGTPAFMAPEMALGEVGIDHRADIYAVGCVGYWLLSGELVFDAPTPIKAMLDHVHSEPTPPSERTEMTIPVDLEKLILACLAKKPDDRPASARDLSEAMLQCDPTHSWQGDRIDKWWETHAPELMTRERSHHARGGFHQVS